MNQTLSCLEIGASRDEAELVVVLMHGLGADAHDFEEVAGAITRAAMPRQWRFVLPNAPTLPVTINAGMRMPAWYDILDLSHPREVDWNTVEESQGAIEALIERESAGKVVLAGFSQGAAMALHVGLRRAVDGIVLMSGYLLESEERPCPKPIGDCPIVIYHGGEDVMVPLKAAERTYEALMAAGYEPSFQVYEEMAHSVCEEEIEALYGWLDRHFPASDGGDG